MLKIRDFSKEYESRVIVQVESLDLDRGIYWIKGKNGSGKSTLFKAISGIIPFDGEVKFNNISLKYDPVAYRRIVNYVEAEPSFPEFLTLKDLISFFSNAKNATKAQQGELLEKFGMSNFYNQTLGTFSTGMLKKAGLILSFLGHPELIVLDEPFASLDHDAHELLNMLILEYHKNFRVTFLISSHIDDSQHLPFDKIFQLEQSRFTELGL